MIVIKDACMQTTFWQTNINVAVMKQALATLTDDKQY